MKPYKIYHPEYGAGTTYNWSKDKYGIRGVGIAAFRLKGRKEFKIETLGSIFKAPCKKIRDFAKKNHTTYWTGKNQTGVLIYVVPIQNFLIWVEDTQEKKDREAKKLSKEQQLTFI